MAVTDLASFPNSRVKTRPPTRVQRTFRIDLIANIVSSFPENLNRTRLDVRRDNATEGDLMLAYDESDFDSNDIMPVFIQEAYSVDSQGEIFFKSSVNMSIYIDEGEG